MAAVSTGNPVVRCVDHAIPFRVFLEEHRARRPKDLFLAACRELPVFYPPHRKEAIWSHVSEARKANLEELEHQQVHRELKKLCAEVAQLQGKIEELKAGSTDHSGEHGRQLRAMEEAIAEQKEKLARQERICRQVDEAVWLILADESQRLRQDLKTLEIELERSTQQRGADSKARQAKVKQKRDECERFQELMWRRLTRLADGVIHAYGKLRQKKVEHARMKSASESLEQFELRQHQRQNRIVTLERRCKKLEDPLRRILHDMDCTGLCLSGGGIRSASFSLGVLQGLSRFSMKSQGNSLMEKLDYLSTVSGGGYIGSWLMAWARRVGYRKVIEQLSTPAVTSGDPEHRPVRHLREYTSYLAPKYGFSLDTLTLAAIVLRNMFLNWLMLVPAVVAMLCLPHMVLYLSYGVPSLGRQNVPLYFWLTMGLACLGIAIAAGVAAKHMAFPREAAGGAASDSTETAEPYGVKWFVGSLFISAWVLGELWLLTQVLTQVLNKDSEEPSWYLLLLWVLSSIPPFVVSWYRARNAVSGSNTLFNRPGALPTDPWWRRLRFWRLAGSFIGAFIAGSAAMLLLWGAGALFAHVLARANVTPDTIHNVSVLTIIPTVLLVLMVASAILSGLLSNLEREEEREWWSRAGGLLMALVLGWLGICAIAYFGREVLRGGMAAGLAALGLSTGFLGSLGGLSAATASGLKHVNKEQLTKVQRFLANHNLIVPAVCAIAALSLAVLFGAFTSWLSGMAIRVATNHPELFRYSNVADFVKYHPAVLVFAGAAVLLLANRFINVNAFSLHGMYRMRLTRAYLGASNLFRRPNPFTNFDPTDNLYEADLPKDGVLRCTSSTPPSTWWLPGTWHGNSVRRSPSRSLRCIAGVGASGTRPRRNTEAIAACASGLPWLSAEPPSTPTWDTTHRLWLRC
jgi:hypothetical protein